MQIISQPRLINPSEIEINQPTVFQHAEPVLSDLERVKRKDMIILNALTEKQKILSQMFQLKGGMEQLNKIADSLAEGKTRQNTKDSKELVLSAIVQANRLLESINEGMRLQMKQKQLEAGREVSAEEEKPDLAKPEGPAVPCYRLTGIAAPLMRSLTALLHSMQQTEDDLKRVREELGHYKQLYQAGSLQSGSEKSSETDHFSDLGSSPSSIGSSSAGNQDFVPPPRVAVGAASSEETLTESKVGTPHVKTPDSLASPVNSNRLSPSRLSVVSDDGPTLTAKSPGPPSPAHRSAGPPSPAQRSPVSPSTAQRSRMSPDVERAKSPNPGVPELGSAKTVQNPSTLPLIRTEEGMKEEPKTPSPPSDDDEKKREKRKQKRQRHTALTGLNGADLPRSEEGENNRKKSDTSTGKLDPVREKVDESSS